VRLELLNAFVPMLVTLAGIVILVGFVLLKAAVPILVTVLGIV